MYTQLDSTLRYRGALQDTLSISEGPDIRACRRAAQTARKVTKSHGDTRIQHALAAHPMKPVDDGSMGPAGVKQRRLCNRVQRCGTKLPQGPNEFQLENVHGARGPFGPASADTIGKRTPSE